MAGMLLWTLPQGLDGWWPMLSPSRSHVLFGGGGEGGRPVARVRRVTDPQTDIALVVGGRPMGWLDSERATCWVETARDAGVRYVLDTHREIEPTDDLGDVVGGNWVGAGSGHWYAVRPGRLVVDGHVVSGDAHGLSVRGPWAVTASVDHAWLHVWRDALPVGRVRKPATANAWSVGDDGTIGYGYHGPARALVGADYRDVDWTVTADGRESPPVAVRAGTESWAWTSTGTHVVGRPLAESHQGTRTPCLWVPAAWVAFDVAWDGSGFMLVGCTSRGQLSCWRVRADERRETADSRSASNLPMPPPRPEPRPTPALRPAERPMKSRAQWADEFSRVNAFYAADDGLRRPGGMVIDRDGVPTADVAAMQQWGYDLLTQPLADVLARIRQSDEWRAKHPERGPT